MNTRENPAETFSSRRFLVAIAALDVLVVALGTIGAKVGFPLIGFEKSLGFLSFAAAAVGILTFFGLLCLVSGLHEGKLPDQGLRTAITVAVMTVYLVIVGEVSFFHKPLGPDKPQPELAQITELMLTNFTWVVGVIVIFFFGSSAYVEARRSREQRNDKNS